MGWFDFSLAEVMMMMNDIGRLFVCLYHGNVGTSIKRISVNKS